MLRIALKGILGRKARLVLTSLAVILGTAFLSGTAVLELESGIYLVPGKPNEFAIPIRIAVSP